jgi:putative transposase
VAPLILKRQIGHIQESAPLGLVFWQTSLPAFRPRRHVSAANRERQPAAAGPSQLWSMDFVSDALFDGRRLRALTVVDTYTREALAIEVDQGIRGEQVVEDEAIGGLSTLPGEDGGYTIIPN